MAQFVQCLSCQYWKRTRVNALTMVAYRPEGFQTLTTSGKMPNIHNYQQHLTIKFLIMRYLYF